MGIRNLAWDAARILAILGFVWANDHDNQFDYDQSQQNFRESRPPPTTNHVIQCNWPFDVQVRIPGIDKFTFKECTQKGEYELFQCEAGKEFDSFRMKCVPRKTPSGWRPFQQAVEIPGYRPQPQSFLSGQPQIGQRQSNFGSQSSTNNNQPIYTPPQTSFGGHQTFSQTHSQQIATNSVGQGNEYSNNNNFNNNNNNDYNSNIGEGLEEYPIEVHSHCTEDGYCPFDEYKLQYCNHGGSKFMQCSPTGWVVKDCPHGTTFSQGRCRDPRNFLGNFNYANNNNRLPAAPLPAPLPAPQAPQPVIFQPPPPAPLAPAPQPQPFWPINKSQPYRPINKQPIKSQPSPPAPVAQPINSLGSKDPQIQKIVFQQVPAPPNVNRYIVKPSGVAYNPQASRQPIYVRQPVQQPVQYQPYTIAQPVRPYPQNAVAQPLPYEQYSGQSVQYGYQQNTAPAQSVQYGHQQGTVVQPVQYERQAYTPNNQGVAQPAAQFQQNSVARSVQYPVQGAVQQPVTNYRTNTCCGGSRGARREPAGDESEFIPYFDDENPLEGVPDNWGTTGNLGRTYDGAHPKGLVNYLSAGLINPTELFSAKTD